MSTAYDKPIPNLVDPDMQRFWEGLHAHRLQAQRCTHCATLRFPALPICAACLNEGVEWVDVSTSGTIWSYVVYHRAFHPGFEKDVPYIVAIVENDDGLRFTGRIVGSAQDDVAIGCRVRAVFGDETPQFTMLHWTLA